MKFLIVLLSFAMFPLHLMAADVVLDVRTPQEFSQGHLKSALNIDFLDSGFKKNITPLDKSETYKVYCRRGKRASKAMSLMKSMGFKHVENVGSLEQAAKVLNLEIVTP